MKIIGAVLATVVVGLLAFQNCQQSPHPDDVAGSGAIDSSKLTDLQGEKISEVNFPFTESETVSKPSGSYSVPVNKNLQVFLDSGRILLTSDLSGSPQEYCLTETLLNELVGILKASQVCKPTEMTPSNDRVCTMVYKFPYAILVTEKATYKLGEASNGCVVPVDLCGDQAQALQGFIASVKANYKTFTCPQ